jgi:hypothetical protein
MPLVKNSMAVSQDLRIVPGLMSPDSLGDMRMDTDFQLVGKTITGVVATPGKENDPRRIWMLQFSDGTHVEFVSPSSRRRLNRLTGGHQRVMEAYAQSPIERVNAA